MDWSRLGLSMLDQPIVQLGSTSVSVLTLMGAALFVGGVWWLASLIERSMLRLARRRADDAASHARIHMISRLLRYVVWVLGTVIGLNQLGIDLSNIALLGSAFAVGLGFGLQNVVSNFVSGIIILLERSLKVGDFVDLESGVRGHVREIAMRYTRVTTNDEIDVLVPNAEFINKRVINWTLDDAHRRIRVPFGVAYGTPKELVKQAGIAAALTLPDVLNTPGREPTVWLNAYGDNSMNYELVVWADRVLTTRPASTHAKLMWALDDELAGRGIAIPFPQRDLHIKSGALDVRMVRDAAANATVDHRGGPDSRLID
jgi:small-conductance mechanosensitive channel